MDQCYNPSATEDAYSPDSLINVNAIARYALPSDLVGSSGPF
jgi:hypothetical protein